MSKKLIVELSDRQYEILQSIPYGSIASRIILDRVKKGVPFEDREKGEWISREGTGECFPFWERHKCSKCGKYGEGTFNFCPNCGADMRGDKAND